MILNDVSRYLPTRDEVARLIASRSYYRSTDVAGALAVGVLVGAGLALLYAPRRGSELRDTLTNRVRDLRNSATRNGDAGERAAMHHP
jgi:hypothetical protein